MKREEGGVFAQSKTIGLVRGLGLLVALLNPPFRFLFPADAYDPLWMRIALSCLVMALVGASYVWKPVVRHSLTLACGCCLLFSVWMLGLTLGNGLAQEYVASYFIFLFTSLFLMRDWKWLLTFMVANGLGAGIGVWMLPHPTFHPVAFLAMTGCIFVISAIGLWAGMVAYRSVSEREQQLQSINRTAFLSANEAILVTDTAGQVLHCNDMFCALWNLPPLTPGEASANSWMPSVQRLLVDPQRIVTLAQAAFRRPSEPVSELLRLTDGRYVKVMGRPVAEDGKPLGRLWFFRDVTSSETKAAAMHTLQARLQRQKEALVRLATQDALYTGSFLDALQIVTKEVAEVMEADRVGIWRLDISTQHLVCEDIYFRVTGQHEQGVTIYAGQSPAYFAQLASERVIHVPNASQDPLTSGFQLPYLTTGKQRNLVDVPLRSAGRLYGVLSSERDGNMHDWSEEDQQFLASIGDILGVLLESGERRKAEAQLANSLALLKAVFESTGVGILVTTPERKVLDCNNTYLSIFHLDLDFALHGDPDAVVAYCRAQTVDPPSLEASMRFLLENPRENHAQNLLFKDGRIVERFTEVLQVDGHVMGRVWFYRDVTSRVRAEQAIMESEMRNKAIVGAIPDLMMRIQVDGMVLDLKLPDTGPLSTFVPQGDVGHIRDVFAAGEFVEEVLRHARTALEEQALLEYETELELMGKGRDFEARLAPSGPHEVLLMLRDVTERKKTERELVQRNHELDSFVYRASHDLKAPLNSLMGLIEILKSESQDPNLVTYLNLMDKSVVKLDTFIRNLTEFSRITRLEIRNQAVDFQELIGEAMEGLRYMPTADRVQPEVKVTPGPSFIGDSFHIGIVLGNLISNAVKYQDLKKPNPWVKIHVTTALQECRIVVEDNGLGIPQAHQGRIFELFYRASSQSFGSGLGLYITRNAVEKMGGSIEMHSEEGTGTRFTVVLPNLNFGVEKVMTDERDAF